MAGEVTLIERIPVELNLGQSDPIIGMASVSKDLDTKEITIEIKMFPQDAVTLEQLIGAFDIKAIGFAGAKRRPQYGG